MRHLKTLPAGQYHVETVVQLLAIAAKTVPGATALVIEEGSRRAMLTYKQLWGRAVAVAAHLADRGLEAGDEVRIELADPLAYIDHFFGVLLGGGIVSDSPEATPITKAMSPGARATPRRFRFPAGDALAIVHSNGLRLTHQDLASNVEATRRALSPQDGDTLACRGARFLLVALAATRPLMVVRRPMGARGTIALFGPEPVDVTSVRSSLARPFYGLKGSMFTIAIGPPGPLMTHTVDAERLERERIAARPEVGARTRVLCSMGRPVEELRVVDESGDPLPDLHVGDLWVRGAPTGDTGYLFAGELYITGSRADMIVRDGHCYDPIDLEHHLARVDGLHDSRTAVIGYDDVGITRLVILCETAETDPVVLERIEAQVRGVAVAAWRFPPALIRFVPRGALPHTRGACRERFLAGRMEPRERGLLRRLFGRRG